MLFALKTFFAQNDLYFTFIHRKTTPLKDTDNDDIEELYPGQILTEQENAVFKRRYYGRYKATTGAETIKYLLSKLNLKEIMEEIRLELKTATKQKKEKLIKRLEIVEAFLQSTNKPEWMVMDVVPVIPPDLRPMVPLDGGRFATSDLNDLYRRILNRNNRLRKFKESIGDKALYVDYNDATDFGKILTDKLILCINSIFIKDKVVINGLEWEEIGDNIKLSDFDKERLKAWTSVDNPDFFQVHFEGGGCIYGLGAVNQYQVKNSKEKIEWDSFFEKLLSLELIKIKGYDKNNNPIYQLKIDAYKYVENNAL